MRKLSILLLFAGIFSVVLLLAFPQATLTIARWYERSVANLELKIARIGKYELAYLERISSVPGAETVIMLHGFPGDKDHWIRFSNYLDDDYHLIAVDLLGFGDSSRPISINYCIPEQAENLRKFVESLELRNFHLIGNSMGGAVSAYYTAKYPEQVLTLGLVNTLGITSTVKTAFELTWTLGNNILLNSTVDEFEQVVDLVFHNEPVLPPGLKSYLAQEGVKHNAFYQKVSDDIHKGEMALEPILPTLQQPLFVLWGGKDQVFDVSKVGIIKGMVENVDSAVLQDVGHLPMLERPDQAAGLYMKFLRRVVTTRPVQHIVGRRAPSESQSTDCIPDSLWSAGSWRWDNKPPHTPLF